MSRFVWTQLVDPAGNAYKGSTVYKVEIPMDADVDDFRRAVKKDSVKLSTIDMENLQVFANKDSFIRSKEPLSSYQSLSNDLGEKGEDPLIVTVPDINVTVDPLLLQFWRSLPLISPMDSILHFDVVPPFFPPKLTNVLIRGCYDDLFQLVLDNRNKGKTQIAITGNPGIGKSVFLFYTLWRLSSINNVGNIVLHRGKDGGKMYVFQNNGFCYRTRERTVVDNLLDDPNTWYLVDTLGRSPEEVNAVTILVASPARIHYKEFLKYAQAEEFPRYMPVWSLAELKKARNLFPGLSKEIIEERYRIVGGIARLCLKESTMDELMLIIDNAFKRMPFDKLKTVKLESEYLKEDDPSHTLVHFDVDCRSYQIAELKMASEYVKQKAFKKFLDLKREELVELLLYTEKVPMHSALQGILFESFADRVLSAGGATFPLRDLDDGSESTLDLSARELTYFQDISECQEEKNYYVPRSRNYPCIDALIPTKHLFQTTISKDHPINFDKMLEIVKKTGINELIFVVPCDIYRDFKKQRFDFKGGEGKSRTMDLKQFVLGIEIK